MRPLAGMAASVLLAQAPAAAAQEEALRLPSGLEARLFEVVSNRPSGGGLIYRFRYVAGGFTAGAERLDAISGDLVWLCETHALPRISNIGPQPGQVVVSLADRESRMAVVHGRCSDVVAISLTQMDRPLAGCVFGDTCAWDRAFNVFKSLDFR